MRTAKDISVYKLSKETDISENHIHSIEKGTSQPSVAVLEKLLDYLGITMSEFFKGGEDIVYPTDYESELLEAVRGLSDEKAKAVLLVAQYRVLTVVANFDDTSLFGKNSRL